MECRLPILREDFDGTERAGTLIWFLSGVMTAVLSVFLLIVVGPFLMAVALIIGILFLGRWMHGLQSDWARAKDLIGDVTLGTTSVDLAIRGQKRTITLSTDIRIDLETHHIQGRPRVWKDVLHNGVATLALHEGSAPTTIKFLVSKTSELNALREVLKGWYRAGYAVQETFGPPSMSVFLMRDNWPYDELQAAKKELGVAGSIPRERS